MHFPALTFKVIGNQWYWAYDMSEYDREGLFDLIDVDMPLTMDSNMLYIDQLVEGQHRLLQVDSELIIPSHFNIRLLITSEDVLHSWAVPSFGVKVDAVPGRLNQVFFNVNREGTFYGMCSEICGVNHGFMPIQVTVKPWYFEF
jgi:heme/copper-type cytochrome/quinol oxidase subunit 2